MQVYYFTRSGRSKGIAEQLASHFQTQAEQIEDGVDWSGAGGYMKAGYFSASGKSLPATYHSPEPEGTVALVFPIWAGTFPPAVRTFIDQVGRARIVCIPTSLGSKLKDRDGFAKVIDLVGKTISAPEEL